MSGKMRWRMDALTLPEHAPLILFSKPRVSAGHSDLKFLYRNQISMHMASVEIPDKYITILNDFGEIQELVSTAIRHYVVELVTRKLEEYKNIIEAMESKYGCDYKTFISFFSSEQFQEELSERHAEWKKDLVRWEESTQALSRWIEKIAKIAQEF